MDSSPTLQDFVLNLIYDPAARSAFELDPESALHAAGLGDITAADVQQVIPLVVDSAPVTGLHGLSGADDLTTGVANLDVAGAVSQLQAITSQAALAPGQFTGDLNFTLGSVNATVVSAAGNSLVGGPLLSDGPVLSGGSVLSGNTFGFAGLSGVTSAVPVGLGGLSAGNDPGLHLDHGVVAPVEHTVTGVAPGVDHLVPGAGPAGILDGGLDTAANLPSSISLDHVPDLDGSGVGGATSSVGSLIKPDLGHASPSDLDPVNGLHNTVSGVGGAAHDLTGGVLHSVTHPAADTQEPSHDLLGGLHL
jgi:hypothetical protein